MFEDFARELPARQRRWLEPIVLLPRAYFPPPASDRQRGFASRSRGFRSFGVAHAAVMSG
jgi:hypothetical protein